ncbi:peptidylprolyl isomerase [Motiliproteus sp. MSK22-1]|uniref:peptidylprolyl isomerase n=1 Tax=Motiliproteus sp. MSK22-1 TaxID=1897630 RepID=UPI002100A425|nr:peptidylprolyl isomerase [Motiliproteus sp. MSK22-1]
MRLLTDMGEIIVQLHPEKAPKTVENFESYVKKGFYDGLIFHRVIGNFMIQGGGFEPGMVERKPGATIQNEADNMLSNLTGTIAMARRQDPHSASAQFFINVNDNTPLDHRSKSAQGWGYAVFGKVVEGMDVVEKIKTTPTTSVGHFRNVPVKDVIILKAEMMQ